MNRPFFVMFALFGLNVCLTAAEHTKDTLETVKKAVGDGSAILIDVREKDEWADGHLQAARSLPLSLLKAGVEPAKLREMMPLKKIVYLHCAAGGRCLEAAKILEKDGFDVRPLKPGYGALLKAGFEPAK